jgi:hypothetical protein
MSMSMTDDAPELTDLPPALHAAMELWERLAAFAWGQSLALDRGVVIVREEDLLAAALAKRAGQPVELPLGFVPVKDVPSGDDFLHAISKYDVKRQVVLLVGRPGKDGAEDDEQLFVLEASEHGRPLPEACFEAMMERG